MKIIKIVLCLIILYTWNACKSQSEPSSDFPDNVESININPDDSQMKNALASNIIDSCHFIQLETSDSIIIGNIKQIFEAGDKYYIYDNSSDIIFIFSQNGHYLSRISKKGRGPQEYVRINDVFVDTLTNDIIISCDRSQSLVRYDCNGKFLKRTPNPFITSAFATINSDTIIAYGGKMPNESVFSKTFPEQYSLVSMCEGNLIHSFSPYKYDPVFTNYISKLHYFFNVTDTLSYIEDFSNIIYRIHSSTQITPRYAIRFGNYTLPINFHTPPQEAKNIIEGYYKNSKQWCDVTSVIENKQLLLINYRFENLINRALYIKSKQKVINIGPIWINDLDGIAMPTICCSSSSNTLLGFHESHNLIELVKNSKKTSPLVQKISQKLTEMDNPVLVKIFLKHELK